MLYKKTGFTFVELVVTTTILAVLSTIGFMAYSNYVIGVRDVKRINDLMLIHDGLQSLSLKGDLPLPESSTTIYAGSGLIGYQGYAGNSILSTLGITDTGLDPADQSYYTYYLYKDRKKIQLMAWLEENSDKLSGDVVGYQLPDFVSSVYAGIPDYQNRFPKVYGKQLGIITDSIGTPLQELFPNTSFDILTASGTLRSYYTDKKYLSGTGLIQSSPNASCKRIHDVGNGDDVSGVYRVDPLGNGGFEVYCDMTTDGGGWTFFGHINSNSIGDNFFSGTGTYRTDRVDDGTKYSIAVSSFQHTEMMATIDNMDVNQALRTKKIVFYKYAVGNTNFNTGPTPCSGAPSFFIRNLPSGKSVSGTWNTCSSIQWSNYISGQIATGFANNAAFGNFSGVGIGGDNTWVHDGWWYVR